MKKILTLLALIAFQSCSLTKNTSDSSDNYFEGIINYSIEYISHNKNYPPEMLENVVGNKMILTFKDGNYMRQFYSTEGDLLSQRFLDLEKNRSYSKYTNNDTTYWYDITKYEFITTFKRIKDSIILNQPTIGIETIAEIQGMTEEYYFAKNLKVDPVWYANYNEANYGEIIKLAKGIQLVQITKDDYWDQHITAESIESKKIDIKEIKIELTENAILKEL